jgi:group I intron endonuclease
MVGIYKIINPKGKIYIGQSIDIERRFKEYKKLQCKQSIKLFNSLKKYGWESHIFEILEKCLLEQLNNKEESYILLFNSHVQGLNIKLASKPSWTGKKRPEHSKFLKENGSGLSYKRTQEHKDNLRKKLSGKKLSKNICEKISQNKIGKKTKKIICLETQQVFNSIKECSEYLNISKGCICSFVKGKYPYLTLKGYTFKYYSKDLGDPGYFL